jgi:hypothetical protein
MDKLLNYLAEKFSTNASKMFIATGIIGWTLSSFAQVGAILFNQNISKEQKSFLVPQEIADALVNIGSFLVITQFTRNLVSKLFSTGKFATKDVRKYLNKNLDLCKNKIGKIDFDIDKTFVNRAFFPKKEYYATKNYYTTLATVGAGIISSNLVTPILRNQVATKMQKNYIDMKNAEIDKQKTLPTFKSSYSFYKNTDLRI